MKKNKIMNKKSKKNKKSKCKKNTFKNLKGGSSKFPGLRKLDLSKKNEYNPSLITGKLTHMNKNDIIKIFKELEKYTISDLNYHEVINIKGRPVIYVKSIKINDEEKDINMGFYISSGTSRKTGLEGYWLPVTNIYKSSNILKGNEIFKYRKPEDKYIMDSKEINPSNYNELQKYMRFINEENAIVSYYLSKNSPELILESIDEKEIEKADKLNNFEEYIHEENIPIQTI